MKHQALFSSKDRSTKKCRLLQFLSGTLRLKRETTCYSVFELQNINTCQIDNMHSGKNIAVKLS